MRLYTVVLSDAYIVILHSRLNEIICDVMEVYESLVTAFIDVAFVGSHVLMKKKLDIPSGISKFATIIKNFVLF